MKVTRWTARDARVLDSYLAELKTQTARPVMKVLRASPGHSPQMAVVLKGALAFDRAHRQFTQRFPGVSIGRIVGVSPATTVR